MSYKRPNPTFFIEQSIGATIVADRLRGLGVTVEVHLDHFAANELDHVWIPAVAQRKWVLLTKDGRIRSRPLERMALESASDLHVFFLGNRGLTGQQMAHAFEKAMPRMLRILANTTVRVIASIHRDGTVTPVKSRIQSEALPLPE